MERTSEVVHDGMDGLDEIGIIPVERACPACGSPCPFDAAAVARSGTAIGWATSPEVTAWQAHVLAWLPLDAGEVDGRRTLGSARDPHCWPSVAPVTCPSCAARPLAVVSYGEVQPARWWLVVDGLVPAPTGPTYEP